MALGAEIEQQRIATDAAISAFYDAISEDEHSDEAAWGVFARDQWKDSTPLSSE